MAENFIPGGRREMNLCKHIEIVFVRTELPMDAWFTHEGMTVKEQVKEFECLYCPNCGENIRGRGFAQEEASSEEV